jgi:hypothetical protein
MVTARMPFNALPPAVLAAVEARTGTVLGAETVSQGLNSEIAARLVTEKGACFVKGLRTSHPRAWTQRREVEVNPFLREDRIAPALLWHVEEEGWVLLGFEALAGHHADYAPGSADLPEVAALLRRLGNVRCPGVELREVGQRLAAYVDHPADAEHFAGDALAHTDLNNENVIVNGSSARLVDWAWASRGAAWLDAAYWTVWLIAAGGHAPASAETWAARVPAWHTARREALTAFAQATANLWEDIAGPDPDPWTARILRASREWARYREGG